MTLFQLYLFTIILPNAAMVVNTVAVSLLVIAGCCVAAGGFVTAIQETVDGFKKGMYYGVRCAIAGATIALLAIPLPTANQLYLLAGGYVATNIKDVSKLPDNVVKAANAWLEKAAKATDINSTK